MSPREQTLTTLLLRARDELNKAIVGDFKTGEPEELVCEIETELGLELSE